MTAYETTILVRSLLDDGLGWYPTIEEIINAINEAQLSLIERYYMFRDERALRPLYCESIPLNNGDFITDAGTYPAMYVRGCRIYENYDIDSFIAVSQDAQFIEYGKYKNIVDDFMPRFYTGKTFPREAIYTVRREYDTGKLKNNIKLYYSGANVTSRAVVWFVKEPYPFFWQKERVPSNDIPLSLPEEYHPIVCAYAAEIINTMDVGEKQRGDVALEHIGQRTTLQQVGDTV